jgi:hypothetical protein
MAFREDDEGIGGDHCGNFLFVFDQVSIIYADRLRNFLNSYFQGRELLGPELIQLVSDTGVFWRTEKFIKEGPDVKYKGRWAEGKRVLEVTEEDGDLEMGEQRQR